MRKNRSNHLYLPQEFATQNDQILKYINYKKKNSLWIHYVVSQFVNLHKNALGVKKENK